MSNALKEQVGGGHYKDCRIQPVEYIHANGLGYIEGAVVKYVTRYKSKGGAEDIRKAIHFLELLLQLEYPPQPPLPDPWDKCKCGEVVAECKCADPVTHLDRNVKVSALCTSCLRAKVCRDITYPAPTACSEYSPNGG